MPSPGIKNRGEAPSNWKGQTLCFGIYRVDRLINR